MRILYGIVFPRFNVWGEERVKTKREIKGRE
jgi:hypothetical protein